MVLQIIPNKQKTQNDTVTALAVSVKDAAEMLGVSTRSIWALAKRNEIQTRKIGARTVFTVSSIEAFLYGTDTVQKHENVSSLNDQKTIGQETISQTSLSGDHIIS